METPELAHYKSVVDDMQISLERTHEELNHLRQEVSLLRRIIATATLYISSFDEDNNLDEGDLLLDMSRQISKYQAWKKDK